jgi:pyruvate dehydrogenase E1 component alpha subunit
MTGVSVDGQDVGAVYDTVSAAIERARAGDGPTLVEAKTYRFRGHSRTDPGRYRPAAEVEHWKARDPIELLAAELVAADVLDDGDPARLRDEVRASVDASAERATQSPIPTLEDLKRYVYVS